jgi:AHBA synthesis associated protein
MIGPSAAKPPLQCSVVVFDLDGVVIDSHDAMRRSFIEAYESCGGERHPVPFEEFHRYQGLHFPDIVDIMGLPPGMYDAFTAASTRNLDRVRICQGIPDLLNRLREGGIVRAIATGKSLHRACEVLQHLGLARNFELICGSDEVERGKPAPDLLELVLERLIVTRRDAVYVGDAVADRLCAKAAEVRFAAATWVNSEAADMEIVDDEFTFSSPDALGSAILGLPSQGA